MTENVVVLVSIEKAGIRSFASQNVSEISRQFDDTHGNPVDQKSRIVMLELDFEKGEVKGKFKDLPEIGKGGPSAYVLGKGPLEEDE